MNGKENFEKLFEAYLQTSETDYAYMLTASWGSGKTYYIKNELLKNDFIKTRKHIYYSLNGLSDIATLKKSVNLAILTDGGVNKDNEHFFAKIFSKIADKLKTSKNTTVNLASNIVSSFSDEIADFFVSADLKNAVIVFDDLERISETIEITDLLGEIYEKYIVNGAKVLFVCDESNLKNHRDEYDKEKEKYIRRTIPFEPDKEIIFQNLLNATKFYETSSDTDKNYYFNALCFYYKNNAQPNFRNVKFILDIFEEIYKTYEICKIEIRSKIISVFQMFYQTIVLANLYKAGNTNEKNLSDTQYYSYLAKNDKNIAQDPYYQARLQLSRYTNAINDLLQSIVDIIFHGSFDINRFKDDILAEQDTLLKRLTHYKRFEQVGLIELLNNIIKELKSKTYSIYDYASLTKSFIPLASKYLTSISLDEIKKLIVESVKNFPEEYIDFYSTKDNPFVSHDLDFSVIPELEEYFADLVANKRKEEIEKFITSLGDDNTDFIYMELSKSQNIFRDILKNSSYCSKILEQNNAGICTFISIISQEILQISNAKDFYKDYIPYLENLSVMARASIQKSDDLLRKEVLEDLDNYVVKAIKHLSENDKL